MASSSYGRNFGFLRSEDRWAEGRLRVPVVEGVLLQGQYVQFDPDAEGFLKLAESDVAAMPGISGLLIQELENDRSIYESDADLLDTRQMGIVKQSRQAVITGGPGVKVWVRNTESETRVDGRVIDAVTMIDLSGLGIGDAVSWDGTQYVKWDNDDFTNVLAHVTAVDSDSARVEMVLV